MNTIKLNSSITGNEKKWTFIGMQQWKQDHEGFIYPPVWSYDNFDPDPAKPPNYYAHELAREDYAFLSSQTFSDTDISVDYKCPYGSVIHGGVIFRALDTTRFYVLDISDMGRKGHYYELSLWLQDESGFRKRLAVSQMPHSIVPESIIQTGPKAREEWNISSPDWVTLRVQASGTYIRISMDGKIAIELRDRTYPVGCCGLVARGAVYFRNLNVSGIPVNLTEDWKKHTGELPRFFYPGGDQPEGFNAYPVVCRTKEDAVVVIWSHAPRLKLPDAPMSIVLTSSKDDGKTWTAPRQIFSSKQGDCVASSIFSHNDGSLSCLMSISSGSEENYNHKTVLISSKDNGITWSEPQELLVGGRSLTHFEGLYSPMIRFSSGIVVMCGYEAKIADGGNHGSNADRRDRSLLFFSSDDGHSFDEPVFFDVNNDDHNECMIAEVEPGKLVAFMRTLRAPAMWTSSSSDGGKTWRSLKQSTVSAECPFLLQHSSGVLVMGSRGLSTFLTLSFDQGNTWTTPYRMSPASAMMSMVEMPDGRILNIIHEGYRVPGYIRGQFFTITPDGPIAAE